MALKRKIEEKLLDVDASMQGSLSFKDPVNLRINGRFEGTLDVKGALTIGSSAMVMADIVGDTVIIGGRVRGKIIAEELARYLEVDLDSIMEWANSGKISGTKEGSSWRFDRKSVDAWVAAGKMK